MGVSEGEGKKRMRICHPFDTEGAPSEKHRSGYDRT